MKIIASIQEFSPDVIEELLAHGVDAFSFPASAASETSLRKIRWTLERRGFLRKVKLCADLLDGTTPSRAMGTEWVMFEAARGVDIKQKKHALVQALGYYPTILAAIGTEEGVENLSDIASAADLVMVHRSLLATRCKGEILGVYQAKIIRAAKLAGKQVCVESTGDVYDLTALCAAGVDAVVLPASSVASARMIIDTVRSLA